MLIPNQKNGLLGKMPLIYLGIPRCKLFLSKYLVGLIQKNNYSDDNLIGCLLEYDIDYPGELYDLHNDYSLAAEKIEVTKEMMSVNFKS